LFGILSVAVAQSDRNTQIFLAAVALAGVPFAIWRTWGRSAAAQL
jgi:hypothetical protein